MAVIVGFGHRKRTGKDTAAGILAEILQDDGITVKQVSFASKLKDICYQLFAWADIQPAVFYDTPGNEHLREVILPKLGKTPRTVWIEVGNLLRQVSPDVWINNALHSEGAQVVLVRDLRYPNEADKIEELGGLRYRVRRPGIPESNDVADSALKDYINWTDDLWNDGTLVQLREKLVPISERVKCLLA